MQRYHVTADGEITCSNCTMDGIKCVIEESKRRKWVDLWPEYGTGTDFEQEAHKCHPSKHHTSPNATAGDERSARLEKWACESYRHHEFRGEKMEWFDHFV